MVVIKVIQGSNSEHPRTQLFEANQPAYNHDAVSSYQEWCDYVKGATDNYSLSRIMLMEEPFERDFNGTTAFPFFAICFDDAEGYRNVLFTRRATVYIMHEGKTVDTIHC